ncbi:MAG TPA: biotin/lipoate--protein ligase family protein [Pseudomonadota bacterium]|nr:biotin/lipoate--protein ligase family protein [Pseudomonadota bacterium]
MHSSSKPALDLPPPFRLVTLREVGDAFAHAIRVAPEEGAGTLVHVGRFDLAELAVVLEPDEPLRSARRAVYAGLAALGDALAAHAPPERPLTFDWPDGVRIDGALVGGGRLGWPRGANEDEPPDWLVFAAMIRTVAMGEGEPGVRPLSSALDEEGFDDLDSGRLVERFSRHFMAALDAWQAQGFDEVAKSYLARLAPARGVYSEIAENGDLLVRPMNVKNMNVKNMGGKNLERRSLLAALCRPSWLDPETGGPRV